MGRRQNRAALGGTALFLVSRLLDFRVELGQKRVFSTNSKMNGGWYFFGIAQCSNS